MEMGRSATASSQEWATPPILVTLVRDFFGGGIDLDPCSNRFSVVRASTEYHLPQNGLSLSWDFPRIFVNPPYGFDRGRGTRIGQWLARCAAARRDHGAEVIALVPVATNTGHWKRSVWPCASAVAFLHATRLKFMVDGREGGKSAPMACCLVYWGNDPARFCAVFRDCAATVRL